MSEDAPPYGDPAAVARTQAAVAAELDMHRQSITIAEAMIVSMAAALSSRFDTFTTWLLAGFGAGVALLLSSHEAAALLSPCAIRSGATLFCWAVVVTVPRRTRQLFTYYLSVPDKNCSALTPYQTEAQVSSPRLARK